MSLSDAQYALKAATRRAVTLAGGPVAAAKSLRVDAGRLSAYGNPESALFVPIDVAAELDRLAGESVILRAWGDLLGFDLVPRNATPDFSMDLLATQAGELARESGEVIAGTIEAAADKRISVNEARPLLENIADMKGTVVKLEEHIRKAVHR